MASSDSDGKFKIYFGVLQLPESLFNYTVMDKIYDEWNWRLFPERKKNNLNDVSISLQAKLPPPTKKKNNYRVPF